jgi:predicted dehydrogenase
MAGPREQAGAGIDIKREPRRAKNARRTGKDCESSVLHALRTRDACGTVSTLASDARRARAMKALVCGLGSIGQRHVRNLRSILGDGVEILAYRQRNRSPVIEPDMTTRPEADPEATYDVRSFADLEEALAERPDVAFITNPNVFHVPFALAAARSGCHLFIEKPLSHSLDGVAELVEIVESEGLVAFVGYQFRFHPGLRLLKSLIEERRLGRLVAAHIVNGEYLPDWHPYEDYRMTHPARQELGGGCLRIQTHELDYATWLFGMPESLFAVGGQLSRLEINVEDSVNLLMQCESEGRPLPVHVHLDYLQCPPERVCHVIGDSGKASYDYYLNVLEVTTANGKTDQVTRFDGFERNRMFFDEMRHFLDCVAGNDLPLVDLREAERSLRVGLAAAKSLKSGRTERL